MLTKKKRTYYYGIHDVYNSVHSAVFDNWDSAKDHIRWVTQNGFGELVYKKFERREDALFFSNNGRVPPVESSAVGEIHVWTDGSARQNNCAGIGVYFGERNPYNQGERFPLPLPTNNRAELWAIRRALEIIATNKDVAPFKDLAKVIIHSDSVYARGCLIEWRSGWQRTDFKNNTINNLDIIRPLWKLIDTYHCAVEIRWEKGHAGNTGNEHADALANEGSSKEIDPNYVNTLIYEEQYKDAVLHLE